MPTLDEALSIMADVHRRRVLFALLDHNPQSVAELSAPAGVRAVDGDREDVRMRMYHSHLPRLEDAGVIRWDRGESTVVKGPAFDEVASLLELLADNAAELPEGELRGVRG